MALKHAWFAPGRVTFFEAFNWLVVMGVTWVWSRFWLLWQKLRKEN